MFKARNNLLPVNIQLMFKDRGGCHDLRNQLNIKKQCIRTTEKEMCLSISGVDLWKGLDEGLKQSTNVYMY